MVKVASVFEIRPRLALDCRKRSAFIQRPLRLGIQAWCNRNRRSRPNNSLRTNLMTDILYVIPTSLEAATSNWRMMVWNTWLALIPLALAYYLFHRPSQRTALWWLGASVFLAFLPNAPYVLTDIIHLIRNIRDGYSVWIVALVLVPQYLLFMLVGFEAYVLSVIALGRYLQRQGLRAVGWVELVVHALCAVGVYLGRFRRFNSWDIVTRPDEVLSTTLTHVLNQRPLMIMAITFCVITVLYWLCKQLTLALAWYWPQRRQMIQ